MKSQLLTTLALSVTLSCTAAPLAIQPTATNSAITQSTPAITANYHPNYAIHSTFELTSNKKGHIEYGNLAALIPLKDSAKLLQFTQVAVQRKNQQWTGNFGIGMRYFPSHFMLGGNAFFNRDYTTHQQTVSLGLEVAANDIKFTANDYLRLSNSWKNSTQLDGYRQQPATGYDVTLQGWLPFFPQLGAQFSYQKYYGGLIALMGNPKQSNSLYSDATNTRIALTYTPIPLITLGTAFQASEDHQHDTQFTLKLHLVLGESLARQLDPNQVANLHTLNGERYSLVQRNNSVVARLQHL